MGDHEIDSLEEWTRTVGEAAMVQWREQISTIMAARPELTDFGFGVYDSHRKTRDQIGVELAKERLAMLQPRSIGEFGLAQQWLGSFKKLSRPNKRGTSYGLKHVAAHSIGYCTNGMFIAAAIAAGFSVERAGPNGYLNISSMAWRPVA